MAGQDRTRQELLDELESLRIELDELRQAGILHQSLRAALQARQEQFERVIETTSEGFFMLDKGLIITEVNRAILRTLGYSREDMMGRKVEEFYDRQYIDFYSASQQHLSFEVRFATRTGRLIPMLFNRSALLDDHGYVYGYVAFVTDLTELKTAREELRRVETNYRVIYENAVQGLFQTTLEGRIVDLNSAYARILGYESREDLLNSVESATEYYPSPEERQHMVRLLQEKGILHNYDLRLKRKDGAMIWLLLNARLTTDLDGLPLVEGLVVDNTDRKEAEEELRRREEKFRYLSVHDNLTGLFNTRYLYQTLADLIVDHQAAGLPISVIFMDMDHFKHVVDNHGHLSGSQALQEVAATIQSCLTKPDFGVAYGGDEFVVVMPGTDKAGAMDKAHEIRRVMKQSQYLTDRGLSVSLTASFGVATLPDDAEDMEGLLALADRMLFDVKGRGKDGVATV
jgi:diguanylate cyclase (GGDEF)-like protein/PAS domain S-box-containing protein